MRLCFFIPYISSAVALAAVFKVLFRENGPINMFCQHVLQMETPPAWFADSSLNKIPIIIFLIWTAIGYELVIYMAAMQNISPSLYEAAEIDGANVFQQIRYITIPLLVPTFITLLLFSLGGIMKGQFDLFYQVIGNNGVLYDVTDIMDTFVYRSLKQDFDIGMSTAAGLYQSVFGFIVIMVTNTLIKRGHPEQALF